jgi:hypothetical protein
MCQNTSGNDQAKHRIKLERRDTIDRAKADRIAVEASARRDGLKALSHAIDNHYR